MQYEIPKEIPNDVLRQRSLFVCTPMYGGQCTGIYTQSITQLALLCQQLGVQFKTYYMFNESLITRARNYCVDEFLRSGFTHLLFIDSDIGFNPHDAISLLALTAEDSPFDIIAGPYPKKCISWEKIKHAVDKGVADKDPQLLERFVGDYVFNLANGQTQFQIGAPVQVLEAGTGFMMIRRETFTKYDEVYPQYMYKPDHVRTQHFDGSREIMAYFDCIIDPESKRYLSEDYFFCQNVRKMGGTVWLCPWMQLKHMGSYIFGGSVADLAAIGASLTADSVSLNKKAGPAIPPLQGVPSVPVKIPVKAPVPQVQPAQIAPPAKKNK